LPEKGRPVGIPRRRIAQLHAAAIDLLDSGNDEGCDGLVGETNQGGRNEMIWQRIT
jgi:hypothetical protein